MCAAWLLKAFLTGSRRAGRRHGFARSCEVEVPQAALFASSMTRI